MSRAQEEPGEGAYSLRLVAIQAGIEVVRDNPLLGVGFNQFGDVRQARAEDWVFSQAAENGLSRAANQFVQTATDGGLGALLVLLLFVVSCGRNALRAASWRQATPSLVASQLWLIGVLVGNQGALWVLGNTTVGFFVFAIAGLAAAASQLARREHAVPVASGGSYRRLQTESSARALAS
jgi:O-antigen ligase